MLALRLRAEIGDLHLALGDFEEVPALETILDEVRLQPGLFQRLESTVAIKALALKLAGLPHRGGPRDQTHLQAFREKHGLLVQGVFEGWLMKNHLTEESLAAALEVDRLAEETAEAVLRSASNLFLNELRLAGVYDRVMIKVQEKSKLLHTMGIEVPSIDHTGMDKDHLAGWLFEQNGLDRPTGGACQAAAALGFNDEESFIRAAAGEYVMK
jgi:hypothetical protein